MSSEIAGDAQICGKIDRDGLKKREMKKLNKIFKVLSPDKRSLVEGMKQQAVFMLVTLTELQSVIDIDGVIDVWQNGKQRIVREHPAAKTYNSMIRNYASLCKQLLDMLPEEKNKEEAVDELMAFVKKAKR